MRHGVVLLILLALVVAACSASPAPPVATAALAPESESASEYMSAPSVAPTPEIRLPNSYATLTKRAWQKLVKAPDSYTGKGYKVWACITQFDAATGPDTFRGDASYHKLSSWFSGDNAFFTGDATQLADYVQGDIVAMSVVGLGSFSYDTQVGGNTTVPAFLVAKIKRLKGSC